VYTYHERQKDKLQNKYGTLKQRLGVDSTKEVDCCCLTLQPVVDGVVTPDGYLYEREAILENLLHQKREYVRQMKEYQRQVEREKQEGLETEAAAHRDRIEAFRQAERGITAAQISSFTKDDKVRTHASDALDEAKSRAFRIKTAKGEQEANHAAFWVPQMAPEASKTKLTKPDKKTRCPTSGRPLKVKDLITVRFTEADPSSSIPLISRPERYMCPVTRTALKGNVEAAVLRPTGRVVTMDCIKRLIKPDMRDPISGEALTDADIIPLKLKASGFAASNQQLSASKVTAMQTAT